MAFARIAGVSLADFAGELNARLLAWVYADAVVRIGDIFVDTLRAMALVGWFGAGAGAISRS
jgi:hypothetical protein